MKKVTLSKMEHRGESRIRVDFPYAAATVQAIKQIEGSKWSQSKKCWHVPYAKTTYQALQSQFEVANIIKTQEEITTSLPSKAPLTSAKETISQTDYHPRKVITGDSIVINQEGEHWLQAYIPYDKKGWIKIVKDIPGRKWNSDGKYWLIPYVKESLRRLNDLVDKKYLQYSFEPNASNIPETIQFPKRKKIRLSSIPLNEVQQKALIAIEEKLLLENKRSRTIKTYKSLFAHFLAYFPDTKPSLITRAQIEKYIIFKKQDNVSDSQLNQLINTLNCFYIRLLNQEEKVIQLIRPKKKKRLPNVYSVEEVELLLKALTNLKHKCQLILIYSGGLRRSEVLNLRVEDLNFNRKTIFLRNAKGGKDRYTFFSDIAQRYLKDYLKQYQPSYYLFEGQYGGRYGESSIQKVFDMARKKARVSSNVTIHGLRHSFATHLIEKGVPLHVVQELLGHSSIKTTEIYLHISNKFRKELKSPLDDMQL